MLLFFVVVIIVLAMSEFAYYEHITYKCCSNVSMNIRTVVCKYAIFISILEWGTWGECLCIISVLYLGKNHSTC